MHVATLDRPFGYGKCGYELIQYMACGRPVMASPVEIDQKSADNDLNGFLAKIIEKIDIYVACFFVFR